MEDKKAAYDKEFREDVVNYKKELGDYKDAVEVLKNLLAYWENSQSEHL